jgi:hypothetical protein
MDTNQPPAYSTPNISPPPAPRYNVFGTKIPSGVAFAIGILLFLLPFAEVKCNGNSFAKNTGLGIAIGKEWKESKSLFGEGLGGTTTTTNNQKNDPNFYAIIGLALGVIGLGLSMTNARAAVGSALVSGILSAGALIGLMIDLKQQAKDPNPMKDKVGGELNNTLNDIKVTIEFTPWYYIAVVSFLAAAFFCYKRIQAAKR